MKAMRLSRSDAQPDNSGVPAGVFQRDSVQRTFETGTTVDTPNGTVAVESLRLGESVFMEDGLRLVQSVQEMNGPGQESWNDADAHETAVNLRKTRFPGVRFIRGQRCQQRIVVSFGPLRPPSRLAAE
jgi:hypothetical protein